VKRFVDLLQSLLRREGVRALTDEHEWGDRRKPLKQETNTLLESCCWNLAVGIVFPAKGLYGLRRAPGQTEEAETHLRDADLPFLIRLLSLPRFADQVVCSSPKK
jgi:hypothetical protein